MMRFAPLVALVLAAPVAAQDRMTQADCLGGWNAVMSMVMPDPAVPDVMVSDDGWCEMRDITVPIEGAVSSKIDTLRWRASDMARVFDLGLPPRSFEIDVQGFRTVPVIGDPVYDYMLALQSSVTDMAFGMSIRWDGVQNTVFLDSAYFDFFPGNRIEGTARVDGVNLTDMTTIQTSAGSFGLVDLTIKSDFDGWFETFAGPVLVPILLNNEDGTPEAQVEALKQGAIAMIATVPETSLPVQSRDALAAFITALPKPRGSLQMQLSSDNGLGMAQTMPLAMNGTGALPAALEAMLDGTTILFTWTPTGDAQ